jgi:hypothetical protein
MLIRSEYGLFNPSLWVKISLQFLPSGESTTTFRYYGIDFNMNRLAIRVIQSPTSSHIVYLDPKGKLIDRVNIPGENSTHISLRDGTIKFNAERKQMLDHSSYIPGARYGQC